MRPAEAIGTCWKKTFQYSGRATRSEFWWFALLWLAVVVAGSSFVSPTTFSKDLIMLALALRVAISLPLLAAAVRRATDAGFDIQWVGWGVAGILFGIGLSEIAATAPSENPVGWMTPVGNLMILIAVASLLYVLTRPSTPLPSPQEVTE